MTLPTDDFSPKELPFVNSGNGFYWCYGTGPNRFYWIYDWNKAKFGVTTPDANEKFAIRCVTGTLRGPRPPLAALLVAEDKEDIDRIHVLIRLCL